MSELHNKYRTQWNRLRNNTMRKHGYICQNPFYLHKDIIKEAKEVHHIITAEINPKEFLNRFNLIPLCPECHKEAHKLLESNPITYAEAFEDYLRLTLTGGEKSLHESTPSPCPSLFSQLSNIKGVHFADSACFYVKDKGYFCKCLKKYRKFPCSLCFQSNIKK